MPQHANGPRIGAMLSQQMVISVGGVLGLSDAPSALLVLAGARLPTPSPDKSWQLLTRVPRHPIGDAEHAPLDAIGFIGQRFPWRHDGNMEIEDAARLSVQQLQCSTLVYNGYSNASEAHPRSIQDVEQLPIRCEP